LIVLEIKYVCPNLDWDQSPVDLKIKKSNRDKAGPEKKTKEKDQKISYAFLGQIKHNWMIF
jgi:hypothetical protein